MGHQVRQAPQAHPVPSDDCSQVAEWWLLQTFEASVDPMGIVDLSRTSRGPCTYESSVACVAGKMYPPPPPGQCILEKQGAGGGGGEWIMGGRASGRTGGRADGRADGRAGGWAGG